MIVGTTITHSTTSTTCSWWRTWRHGKPRVWKEVGNLKLQQHNLTGNRWCSIRIVYRFLPNIWNVSILVFCVTFWLSLIWIVVTLCASCASVCLINKSFVLSYLFCNNFWAWILLCNIEEKQFLTWEQDWCWKLWCCFQR